MRTLERTIVVLIIPFLLPLVTLAEDSRMTIDSLIYKINDTIINPLIGFLFALGLVLFLYGVAIFLKNRSEQPDKAIEGRNHMFWGIIGMAIMISVFSIMQFIVRSLRVEGINIQTGEVTLTGADDYDDVLSVDNSFSSGAQAVDAAFQNALGNFNSSGTIPSNTVTVTGLPGSTTSPNNENTDSQFALNENDFQLHWDQAQVIMVGTAPDLRAAIRIPYTYSGPAPIDPTPYIADQMYLSLNLSNGINLDELSVVGQSDGSVLFFPDETGIPLVNGLDWSESTVNQAFGLPATFDIGSTATLFDRASSITDPSSPGAPSGDDNQPENPGTTGDPDIIGFDFDNIEFTTDGQGNTFIAIPTSGTIPTEGIITIEYIDGKITVSRYGVQNPQTSNQRIIISAEKLWNLRYANRGYADADLADIQRDVVDKMQYISDPAPSGPFNIEPTIVSATIDNFDMTQATVGIANPADWGVVGQSEEIAYLKIYSSNSTVRNMPYGLAFDLGQAGGDTVFIIPATPGDSFNTVGFSAGPSTNGRALTLIRVEHLWSTVFPDETYDGRNLQHRRLENKLKGIYQVIY